MKNILIAAAGASLCLMSSAFLLQPNSRIQHKSFNRKETEGAEALQYLSAMESYPNADIPKDGFTKAYSFYKANYLSRLQPRSTNSWRSLGPTNVAGRTLAIVVDPTDTSILWAGAATGGLWKSTTGGLGANAWSSVNIGYPVLGVSTIAINASNHNEMFIGTGEVYQYQNATGGFVVRTTRGSYGMGIYKSVDGGNSWSQSLDWTYQQNTGIWKIVFNPKNPKTVYAATTEGVIKSMDDGASWNLVLNEQMVMDLQIDPSDTGTLYAGVGDQGDVSQAGVYVTTDAGSTWNHALAQNNSGRTTIAIYPSNHLEVYALLANVSGTVGIFFSNDKGQHWSQQISDGTGMAIGYVQGWYAKLLIVKADDDATVLAGGVDFYKSTDFAQTWITTDNPYDGFFPVHVDFHDVIANPEDNNKIYVASDGGIFRSNDFGSTFFPAHDGMNSTQFYSGDAAIDDSTLIFGGLQDNSVVQWSGSNPWLFYEYFGDGEFPVYNNLNHNVQAAAENSGFADFTVDGGANWQFSFYDTTNFPNAVGAFVGPMVKCPSDPNRIYDCIGGVYKSTDFGQNFFLLPGYTFDLAAIAIGVSAQNADVFYVGSSPVTFQGVDEGMHFFKTTDGGQTFTDITGILPDRYPRDIAVDPTNSNIVYAVFSGFGTGHVFKTIDGGASWTDISGTLPDLPVNTVLIDPLNSSAIYIGTDFNIFVSMDGGNSWTDYSQGLPSVTKVYRLVNSPLDRKIIVFTHGHGAYKGNYISTTAVAVINASDEIKLSPNPADHFLNIDMQILSPSSSCKIIIRNSSGELVSEGTSNGKSEFQINTSLLPAGTYVCSIIDGAKTIHKKFLVVHS